MEAVQIDRLCAMVAASGLVTHPQIGAGFVFGRARLPVADADININLDPEIDEGGSDADTLVAKAARLLSATG